MSRLARLLFQLLTWVEGAEYPPCGHRPQHVLPHWEGSLPEVWLLSWGFRHPIIPPQGFGDTIHKTRFWGLLGKQRLCQYQVLPPTSKSQGLKVIFAGSRSKECPSASSTPTSPPTPSSTRLGSRATTRSWESTSSPRRAGRRWSCTTITWSGQATSTFGLRRAYSTILRQVTLNLQDLNSCSKVVRLVEENKLGQLLARDQLSLARKNGEAFGELQETLPSFPPSYKYKWEISFT